MEATRAGIKPRTGKWIEVTCYCGKTSEKIRASWKISSRRYCGRPCYMAEIKSHSYHPWRQGQRLARAIVSQHFTLQPGHVVDHRNGDDRNNDLSNLRVYASQADHMRMHRGGDVTPVWDGA